jgi:hypothetical protein
MLILEPEGKRPLGKPRHEGKDNIKIKRNRTWSCKLDLTGQRPVVDPLSTVLYYVVPQNFGKFLDELKGY